MPMRTIQQRAQRITRFVVVHYITLAGWVLVQSTFSLSSRGRTIPCALLMVLEAIGWMATLLLLFVLFKREYTRFTQAVLELEEANKRLRKATNTLLRERKNQSDQEREDR